MKSQIRTLDLIVIATLTTLTMTACGSNSLPSELTDSSVIAAQTPQYLPLTGYATAPSIQVGQTSAIIASEGKAGYTYSASTTAYGTLSGNVFTGTVVGDTVITISDSAGANFPVTIKVVAAEVVIPPAPPTKLLYRYNVFTAAGQQKRLYTDTNVTPQGYAFENKTFKVLINDQTPGTEALRECTDNYPGAVVNSLFQSNDANCEGTTVGRVLGYVYKDSAAGLIPVRRYSFVYYSPYLGNLIDRLLIVGDDPSPNGYQLDRIVGWVPTP